MRQSQIIYFQRITPAYAGKSDHENASKKSEEDHPRIRGEKKTISAVPDRLSGSPPHTRGKAFALLIDKNLIRITPAYAGKSRGKGKVLC